MSEDTRFGPVMIIGAGLIGASVGCTLTEAGEEVFLRDLTPSHATVAASRGAGRVGAVDPDAIGLVVVAVPPAHLAEVVAAALAEFPNAFVVDVGSVKHALLVDLQGRDVDLGRYLGTHPMAGSHHAGPITARADLFVDRTWAITPHPSATPGALSTARDLAACCGAREVVMDAAEHDRAVAEVSHLPHAVSAMVAAGLTTVSPDHLRLAGPGVRDVTRIAGGDPGLWDQILAANSTVVGGLLDDLITRLQDLSGRLAEGRSVRGLLEDGVAGTRAIPGKHGAPSTAYARVSVEIPDTPGAFARLFADADRAGVNIEDISIEHDQVRPRGWLSLAVTPDRVAHLEQTMRNAGWQTQKLAEDTKA